MTYLKDIATKLSFSLSFSVIVMLWFTTASTVAGQQDGPLVSDDVKTMDFVTDVQPILQRSCYACHGPDKQKSGYRTDLRTVALQGGDSGEPAIVPHDAKSSSLIRYVSGDDEEMLMPPPYSDLALVDTTQPKISI